MFQFSPWQNDIWTKSKRQQQQKAGRTPDRFLMAFPYVSRHNCEMCGAAFWTGLPWNCLHAPADSLKGEGTCRKWEHIFVEPTLHFQWIAAWLQLELNQLECCWLKFSYLYLLWFTPRGSRRVWVCFMRSGCYLSVTAVPVLKASRRIKTLNVLLLQLYVRRVGGIWSRATVAVGTFTSDN